MDDEARRVILLRRARFIAAALAGAGMGCAPDQPPEPCLAPPIYVPEPAPAEGDPDAAPPPRSDAGPAPTASEIVAPPPQVCLSEF